MKFDLTERVNGQRVRCYDYGCTCADRYTVVYLDQPEHDDLFACVGMSASPFHPQGIGQHSAAKVGRHLGKQIPFASLPEDCRKLVEQDTTSGFSPPTPILTPANAIPDNLAEMAEKHGEAGA